MIQTTAIRALVMGAVLAKALAPASAQTAEQEAEAIMALLNFDGVTSHGELTMQTDVTDCVFLVDFTVQEDGYLVRSNMTGDLDFVTSEHITLRLNGAMRELHFLLPGPSSDWQINLDVDTANPLYDDLISDPDAFPDLNAECRETGCQVSFDLGDDSDTFQMNLDLTEILTASEADRLLASFQNLANLCNGPME